MSVVVERGGECHCEDMHALSHSCGTMVMLWCVGCGGPPVASGHGYR